MELSCPNIKKFFTFSQNNVFHISRNGTFFLKNLYFNRELSEFEE